MGTDVIMRTPASDGLTRPARIRARPLPRPMAGIKMIIHGLQGDPGDPSDFSSGSAGEGSGSSAMLTGIPILALISVGTLVDIAVITSKVAATLHLQNELSRKGNSGLLAAQISAA